FHGILPVLGHLPYEAGPRHDGIPREAGIDWRVGGSGEPLIAAASSLADSPGVVRISDAEVQRHSGKCQTVREKGRVAGEDAILADRGIVDVELSGLRHPVRVVPDRKSVALPHVVAAAAVTAPPLDSYFELMAGSRPAVLVKRQPELRFE